MASLDIIPGSSWMRLARLLEGLGCRAFYSFLAPEWHRLPSVAGLQAGEEIPIEGYRKGLRDARYYAGANGLRLLTYVPIFIGYQKYAGVFGWSSLGLLTAFHVVSIFTEAYKYAILRLAKEWGRVKEGLKWPLGPDPVSPATRGYFAPLRYETKAGYVGIGMEWFRIRVVLFVDGLSGGPAQERGSRKGLFNFTNDTIAAEKIHLIGGALSAALMIPFVVNRAYGYAGYVSILVMLDTYLVMLQRYHRTRVWEALRLERGNDRQPKLSSADPVASDSKESLK
jgi:hypothetical protein